MQMGAADVARFLAQNRVCTKSRRRAARRAQGQRGQLEEKATATVALLR